MNIDDNNDANNNKYQCMASEIIEIFKVKVDTTENAIIAVNSLTKYNTWILSILLAFDIVYKIMTGSEPFWGIITLGIIGFLTFCYWKWKSRIASICYFLILLLCVIGCIMLFIDKSFVNANAYEVIFIIPMFNIAWKMIKSSYILQKSKKHENKVQDTTVAWQNCEEKNIEAVHENEPLYNTVPIWKVIILLILSLGVYVIPWAYNLWKQGQKKYNKKISPFWRSIFISFTSFKLFPLINDYLMNPPKKETENINNDIINRYLNDSEIKPFPATCFAWIYLMFSWVANALNKMGSYSQSFTIAELLALILNIIALIPIVIIQLKINATNYRYSIQAKNDTWTWKTTGFVALWFLLVFTVTIITAIMSYT